MVMNLFLGIGVMAVCLALQLILVARAMRYFFRHDYLLDKATFGATMRIIFGVMAILVFGNIAQIAIWALLFQSLGEFADFTTAVYHSAVNFATLGYGDIVMSEKHRLLGPLEAVNGVLMIGVSTSALMSVFQKVFTHAAAVRKSGNTG